MDRDESRHLGAPDVRAARPPKAMLDPWHAQGWQLESERQPNGKRISDLTVFLTGRECPWACVFCDLWRYTTDAPTPPGALPAQLEKALDEAGSMDASAQLKLYNASNFFDAKAVPVSDDDALTAHCRGFDRVIVESHPKLVGDRTRRFADHIDGSLEVAMGLETVHPRAQPQLGKGADLDDYAGAIRFMRENGIDWRAFVLVGAPFVPPAEDAHWVAETVRFALDRGARHVSLIPVRGGNGSLEALEEQGDWTPPTLASLETALGAALDVAAEVRTDTVTTVDLWDIEALAGGCDDCRAERVERLRASNASGRFVHVPCAACSAAPSSHGR